MSDIKARLPLLILIALLIISSVYYVLVYVPLQNKTNELKEKCSSIQQEIKLYDTYLSGIDNVRENVKTLKNETDTFRSESFRVNGTNLIYEMQDAVKDSGVILSAINIGESKVLYTSTDVKINMLEFEISLVCDYQQLLSFLDFYENSQDSYFHVLSVNTGDLMSTFEARVSFAFYYPESIDIG